MKDLYLKGQKRLLATATAVNPKFRRSLIIARLFIALKRIDRAHLVIL